ncbi:MAG: hypothetical protein PHV85_07990 [Desulfovibrionaceae bacterium]|nr:hypothetical protein [Desulfovibrionaceae bacterium]
MQEQAANRKAVAIICAALVLAVFCLYGRTIGFELTTLDDNVYVSDNPEVIGGLGLENAKWALTTFKTGNYIPLTWLSHQLDSTLFGSSHGLRHLANVGLHALNAVLFFLLLLTLTKRQWPSALAAALFALHPLHVESVAWVSERKDVLSTMFFLLGLMAYVRFARGSGRRDYLAAFFCLLAGLLAKPMLVTMPFVMLLLDYWPLERFPRPGGPGPRAGVLKLIREKIPFFALVSAWIPLMILAQHKSRAVAPILAYPFWLRLENALVSYMTYLAKLVVPSGLAAWYPFPEFVPLWKAIAAALVLICLSLIAIRQRRDRPYLLVGWLWFLGTLVPVIGIVQVGGQAMADRYAYVPFMGLYMALGLCLADAVKALGLKRRTAAACAAGLLIALAATSWVQAGYWKDNLSLFGRALAVTKDNYFAHNNIANEYRRRKDLPKAVEHFKQVAVIKPGNLDSRIQIAYLSMIMGDLAQAEEYARQALAVAPDNPAALVTMGAVLLRQGWRNMAREYFVKALIIDPDMPIAKRYLSRL